MLLEAEANAVIERLRRRLEQTTSIVADFCRDTVEPIVLRNVACQEKLEDARVEAVQLKDRQADAVVLRERRRETASTRKAESEALQGEIQQLEARSMQCARSVELQADVVAKLKLELEAVEQEMEQLRSSHDEHMSHVSAEMARYAAMTGMDLARIKAPDGSNTKCMRYTLQHLSSCPEQTGTIKLLWRGNACEVVETSPAIEGAEAVVAAYNEHKHMQLLFMELRQLFQEHYAPAKAEQKRERRDAARREEERRHQLLEESTLMADSVLEEMDRLAQSQIDDPATEEQENIEPVLGQA
ncbi:uncharacterized protein MONBRDRAFT_32943 [Monosiga brevicollis MX1]|uniref:Kinetochore protein SPC25 n=1 Tax=Monosiga brevicollis TaxID=81824 RepID=A9V2N4_MONBE|nr:uncharacterized protein MONBRDRAFT_32943 [Monosiga brevicollis MX1]EDQ88288.1 predicted protein [Monosiga brevicollis MX1]|eukprot:XP_001746881.1 hypothetical protein [Monosiga brevicollis MX1]